MPRPTSAHTLGPHVIGRRIVVRRRLPGQVGPTGGPAMTDLLGVCTAWGEEGCVVEPDSGPAVRITLADIVSGKPVPPRPSPRLRISVDAAQRRAMTLFPGLHTEPLGAWTLRHAAGVAARRANSVLAVTGWAADQDVAYDAVLSWYADRGRRPIAAVLRDSDQEQLFLERGWGPESADADTVFQLGSVSRLARLARARTGGSATAAQAALVQDGSLVTATVGSGLATGVAVLDDDWVGLRGIAVDPAHRRRGLARGVVSALAGWAAEQGATTAYLQVLSDNEPALDLYAGLGFTEHHRYRYLAAPLE